MEKIDPTNDKPEHTHYQRTDQYPSQQPSHPTNETNKKEFQSEEPHSIDNAPIRHHQPDNNKAESPFTARTSKISPVTADTPSTISSGPQIFVVRPLPNLPSPTFKLQEEPQKDDDKPKDKYANLQSTKSSASKEIDNLVSVKDIPDHKIERGKSQEQIQLELTKENEFLQMALNNANFELNAKDIEFQNRVAALNQNYGSSLNEMRVLLASQRKLGNRWKEEMSSLTQIFETKIRDLSVENRQLKRLAEQLKADLNEKTMETKEAREMNGIYSARLTKMQRNFKKLRDQDEESYIEMTF